MEFKEYINNIFIINELPNNNYLTEAGLSRILQKVKQKDNDFAVISAYKDKYSKKENIQRNRKIRAELSKKKSLKISIKRRSKYSDLICSCSLTGKINGCHPLDMDLISIGCFN